MPGTVQSLPRHAEISQSGPSITKLPHSSAHSAGFNHAVQFLNTVKVRLSHEPETYKEFLKMLQEYQKQRLTYQEVFKANRTTLNQITQIIDLSPWMLHQVSILFKDAPDLIDEFMQFPFGPNGAHPASRG